MCKSGAINFRFNIFWFVLLLLLLQRKCDTCISTPGCLYFANGSKYSCSEAMWNEDNFTTLDMKERKSVKILELCNLYSDILDLGQLNKDFPNVENVTFWKGNISALIGSFHPDNKVKVLLLKALSIEDIPHNFLKPLKFLEFLDLSENHLKNLTTETVEQISRIPHVNLTRNHWDCSQDLEWVLKLNNSTLTNIEELKCYQTPYPDRPLIPVAQFKNNVNTYCPQECECSMPDVVRDPRDPKNIKLEPIIYVNCSDRGLTDVPSVIPNKTKILMLKRNNIYNLATLIKNPAYKDVQELYLDNNFITTIRDLEVIDWFSKFRVLSVRNNKLTQLPIYALNNALKYNPNMPVALGIFLGGNPWRCDCIFTPEFQEMLQQFETQIKDSDDIKCSYLEGDENSMALIIKLSRSSVCRLPSEYSVQALDLLIGILATLIVLILGKLAYDYYHYKKTGRLPWIATKMP